MRYVLFMVINKCHIPQFIGGLQNSVPVKNQSKMPIIQKKNLGLQLPNLTLMRSSPLLRKMQSAQMINLDLNSIYRILKVTKINARRIPHLLTEEQKRMRVQMANSC